jgi:alkylhydroperoxidase family enzyme
LRCARSSAASKAECGETSRRYATSRSTDITASRYARASDPKDEAGLVFAQAIVVNRGDVSDDAVKKVRAAGFTDGEITELVAHVAINIFSNYYNNVAQTVLDFPRVELSLATAG